MWGWLNVPGHSNCHRKVPTVTAGSELRTRVRCYVGMSGGMQPGSALRTSSGNLSGGRMPMYQPQQAGEMKPSLPSVSGQYGGMPGASCNNLSTI